MASNEKMKQSFVSPHEFHESGYSIAEIEAAFAERDALREKCYKYELAIARLKNRLKFFAPKGLEKETDEDETSENTIH